MTWHYLRTLHAHLLSYFFISLLPCFLSYFLTCFTLLYFACFLASLLRCFLASLLPCFLPSVLTYLLAYLLTFLHRLIHIDVHWHASAFINIHWHALTFMNIHWHTLTYIRTDTQILYKSLLIFSLCPYWNVLHGLAEGQYRAWSASKHFTTWTLAWGFGAWRSQGPQRNGHLLGLLTTYEWDDPPSAAIYEILWECGFPPCSKALAELAKSGHFAGTCF